MSSSASASDASYGVRSTVDRLARVMVRTPATTGDWVGAGWRTPDTTLLLRQHDALVQLLTDLGCEVIVAPPIDGLVDAVYVYDSAFVVGRGAIVLRSPKPNRQDESEHAELSLRAAGVPIIARLDGDARADGGDMFHLEDGTLVVGRSYRTNALAQRQIAAILADEDADVIAVDMPHDRGPDYCLHLLSVVSPIHANLAVVYEPLSPVSLLDALRQRDVEWIAVDHDEYVTMATNVLAVRPGVVVMVDGSPRTRKALEGRGVDVHTFDGSELCHKGDGGPTCLTRPLARVRSEV